MATAVYMPKNGMDMQEGRIIHWLKNVGDHVEMDEPIMEIETDKITMEAESPATGTLLAQLYPDDTTVPVLTTIGCPCRRRGSCPRGGSRSCGSSRPRGSRCPCPERSRSHRGVHAQERHGHAGGPDHSLAEGSGRPCGDG